MIHIDDLSHTVSGSVSDIPMFCRNLCCFYARWQLQVKICACKCSRARNSRKTHQYVNRFKCGTFCILFIASPLSIHEGGRNGRGAMQMQRYFHPKHLSETIITANLAKWPLTRENGGRDLGGCIPVSRNFEHLTNAKGMSFESTLTAFSRGELKIVRGFQFHV